MRAALFVVVLSACSCGVPSACDFELSDASVAGDLVLGQYADGAFVPFDDEAELVLGPQGGWMVLLAARLPEELLGAACVRLEVFPVVDGEPLPPTVRQLNVPGALVEPIPIFLGFDVEEGQSLSLDVQARAGAFIGESRVVDLRLRRAR